MRLQNLLEWMTRNGCFKTHHTQIRESTVYPTRLLVEAMNNTCKSILVRTESAWVPR